jgi:hypothetical protein
LIVGLDEAEEECMLGFGGESQKERDNYDDVHICWRIKLKLILDT